MQKQRAHFPFVNLEKALGRAKELYGADPSGRQMSLHAAYGVWKYSIKSSGGHQTVSALKSYGLTDATGIKGDRKLSLSQKALQYFKDEREEERERLLREFALNPKLFAQLWGESNWKSAPPSDAVARSHLKVDLHLSEQAARSILGIYKDNLSFANFTGDDKLDPSATKAKDTNGEELAPPTVKVGDYVQWTSGGQDMFKPPRQVVRIADDLSHLQVFGSPTGVPMSEVTIVENPGQGKPPTPAHQAAGGGGGAGQGQALDAGKGGGTKVNVTAYVVGDRLQLTADVDAAGITKLKDLLTKYEEILKLMN